MAWLNEVNRYLTLDGWQKRCHQVAKKAGWWDNEVNPLLVATKLALIHSEVSEALEGYRKDVMDDHLPDRKAVEVELADALYRTFDLAEALGLDLEGALIDKFRYNLTRADHTPEARAAAGGKRF